MSKLKGKKYKIILLILLLILGIVGLVSLGQVDKYKGQIAVTDIKVGKKVLSSVGNTSFSTSKGYDEVEYEVKYTLDEIEGITKRDVVIKGTIDEIDSKYAYFNEINKSNITSTLRNSGREIEVLIRNVPLGEEQVIKLKIVVEGAPNGKIITPEIEIKEASGEYTRVQTEGIKVETNSLDGIVYDENKAPVSNIELSIYKGRKEIRRTYTDETGRFIFTDLEEGEYNIHLEE